MINKHIVGYQFKSSENPTVNSLQKKLFLDHSANALTFTRYHLHENNLRLYQNDDESIMSF